MSDYTLEGNQRSACYWIGRLEAQIAELPMPEETRTKLLAGAQTIFDAYKCEIEDGTAPAMKESK